MWIQWGNVAEWFAAVGTVGALGFAAQSIRQASRTEVGRQAETQWDEANKTSFSVTPFSTPGGSGPNDWSLIVSFNNGGKRSVFDVELDILIGDWIGATVRFEFTGSGQTNAETLPWKEDFGSISDFHPSTIATFSDTAENRWRLDENHMLMKAPRKWSGPRLQSNEQQS